MAEGIGGRVRSLDALRGIAAMAVVVFHLTDGFDQDQYFGPPNYDYEPASFQFALGRYGVNLFFMISGVVILMSLRRSSRVRDFAISRFSRLYPPYWAALVFTSAYILLTDLPPLRFSAVQWLANVTMVPKWFGQREVDDVYWTLGVEMAFYVFAGIMFALGWTRRERIVRVLAIVFFANLLLETALRAGGQVSEGFVHLFVAGMALFVLASDRPSDRRTRVLLLVMVFGAFLVPLIAGSEGGAAVTLAISTVMYLAVAGHLGFLVNRPLLFLGEISYSLYLLHAYPGYITLTYLLDAGLQRDLAVLVVIVQSMALAILMNRTIEQHVSPWVRRRLAQGATRAASAA